MLFVIVSYGLNKSLYALIQVGTLIYIILSLQFFIFFFAPKDIDISIFLPIILNDFGGNLSIFLISLSLILFPLLSLPLANIAASSFKYKELIILSFILFISNSYFLFINTN